MQKIDGGFFSLDMAALKSALEDQPWIESVAIRRVWPDVLQITANEQQPVAIWNDARVINSKGQLFDPLDKELPPHLVKVSGPKDAHQILMGHYFAIAELILLQTFWGIAFRIGIPVKRTTLEINTKNFHPEIGKTVRMKEGKFRFTPKRKAYFLSRLFVFRIITPFPFKAVATFDERNKVDIVARIPIGTTLFVLFWLLGWTG